jgi:gamma-glutamylcyclotransferase (GGCT)/AIG2-like uncharacterized protein YtfP
MSARNLVKVFVYGTLKPGEANYQAYCADRPLNVRTCYALGELYHLPARGYPAMTDGARHIQGCLLTFPDPNILIELDRLEDYQSERAPVDNEYQRELIEVYDRLDQPLDRAWVYLMEPNKVRQLQGILVLSGSWSGVDFVEV